MAAPSLKEIEWAIAQLEEQESSEGNYALLAALYTCRNEMTGAPPARQPRARAAYSEFSAPEGEMGQYGDSEFLQAAAGKDPKAAWNVMDELMDTLKVVNQRAYDSVIRKLSRL